MKHQPTPALLRALRRGDRTAMLSEAKQIAGEDHAELLADLALELRRRNVAVLGSHEAFIRRRGDGTLQQVIEPVRLSVAAGDLYQIPMRRPFWIKEDGTLGEQVRGRAPRDGVRWVDMNSHVAHLTYQGYQRINAVVGASVPQPSQVVVGGERRTNPYVERRTRPDGRPGDITRVVVGVVVIGPAPATGNLVAVSYVLDYDPARDLQHMLASVAEKHQDDCVLCSESDPLATKAGWHYVDVYGGVGYAFNLRIEAIRDTYRDFIGLLQNAVKKAQTVARRNAMRSHPAFGAYAQVTVDDEGRAVLGIRGWTMSAEAEEQWEAVAQQLERGRPLPELAEIIDADAVTEIEEVYDPEVVEHAAPDPAERKVIEHDEADEVARLRILVEQGLDVLGGDAADRYGYDPGATYTEDQLNELNAAINREIDEDNR